MSDFIVLDLCLGDVHLIPLDDVRIRETGKDSVIIIIIMPAAIND